MNRQRTGLEPAPSRGETWRAGVYLLFGYLLLLYIIEAINQLGRHSLNKYGIHPLEIDGLWGIIFAPFLHGSWGHLNANAGVIVILGLVGVFVGLGRFLAATGIIWCVGGAGTWLIGDMGNRWSTVHVGASGVIFGWLTFLMLQGVFSRRLSQILVGIVVGIGYGSLLWGVLPGQVGISWQGHVCGAASGVLAAFLLARRSGSHTATALAKY